MKVFKMHIMRLMRFVVYALIIGQKNQIKDKMRNIPILLLIVLGLSMSSCQKDFDDPENANPDQNMSMGNLSISKTFGYETFKIYDFTLTAYTDGLAELMSEDGTAYQRFFLQKRSPFELKVAIPTYEDHVILKFKNKEIKLELESSFMNYEID